VPEPEPVPARARVSPQSRFNPLKR
jgi:hypothetical protein